MPCTYVCLFCGKREALTHHLRVQIYFTAARDAAIIVVYLRMHVYSQTTYVSYNDYLRVIEVVGFKLKVRRIALHMTFLEGA